MKRLYLIIRRTTILAPRGEGHRDAATHHLGVVSFTRRAALTTPAFWHPRLPLCWGGSEHLALSLGRCFSRAAEIHWTARVCCSRWSLPAAAASHGGIVVTVRASLGFCAQSHKMWAAVALSDSHTRHKSLTYTLEHTCFMSTGVGSDPVCNCRNVTASLRVRPG